MANRVFIIDKHAHVEKAKAIYQQLRSQLEAEHKGEIVAIEPESGDFFLGANVIEAVLKGREKHPDRVFHSIRIGYPAVHARK